jgi:hypothetical protein
MARGRKGKDFAPTDTWPQKGKHPKSTAKERLDYCRQEWERDPTIPINGRGGMSRRLLEIFGKTARDEQLIVIRNEIVAKHKERKKERQRMNPVLTNEQRLALTKPPTEKRIVENVENVERARDAAEEKKQPAAPVPLKVVSDDAERKEFEKKVAAALPEEPKKARSIPLVPAPGAGRTIEDAAVRYEFARDFIRRHPDAINAKVQSMLVDQFGKGISTNALGTIRRELGVGRIRRRRNERARTTKRSRPVAQMPVPTPEPAPAPPPQVEPTKEPLVEAVPVKEEKSAVSVKTEESTKGPNAPKQGGSQEPAEAIRAAVQMLLEEVPSLRRLELNVSDDGKPSVKWAVRTEGELEL